MTTFTWLHLTDFHAGMRDDNCYWDRSEQAFLDDLKYLYRKTRPWDLILFTGDLVNRGQSTEFETVNELLQRLSQTINRLQKELQENHPIKFLAVPGNHDLIRPQNREDDGEFNRAIQRLTNRRTDEDLPNYFWEEPNCAERRVIQDVFEPYCSWFGWGTNTSSNASIPNEWLPGPENINYGIIPGDFSYILRKEDAELGIVGLNSSFLHLRDVQRGDLVLNVNQFNAVRPDRRGASWTRERHTCLLMTHHPPSWLNQHSRNHLHQQITSTDFTVHLYGHMHTPGYRSIGTSGAISQRFCQGRSLFGLEYVNQAQSIERSHGYMIGKITLTGERNGTDGKLYFFPRKLYTYDNSYKLGSDHDCFTLPDDICSEIINIVLNREYYPTDEQLRLIRGIFDSPNDRHDSLMRLYNDIQITQQQSEQWKELHEKFQKAVLGLSSCHSLLLQWTLEINNKPEKSVTLIPLIRQLWVTFCQDEMELSINLANDLSNNSVISAILQNLTDDCGSSYLENIEDTFQSLDGILGRLNELNRQNKNLIQRQICILGVALNEFLKVIDDQLKESVNHLKELIENLPTN
ncbi:MAG: metallophosphoesterase [Crocosphaera sp.]|nr:metallophosphoesterase [Crocosphaera sp.]